MLRTLFYIPHRLAGIPVFGIGWVLGVVLLAGVAYLGWLMRRRGWDEETRGIAVTFAILAGVAAFVLPALEVTERGRIMGLAIRGYGAFMLAGVVSGVALAAYRARRLGLDPEVIYALAPWTCGLGLVGARLFYVVQFWNQFRGATLLETVQAIVRFSDGGLVVYGSFFGGILGLIIYSRLHGMSALRLADLAAPSLMLGVGFGRLGCLMNGCCFGGVCESGLPSIRFPMDSPAFVSQMEHGLFFGARLVNASSSRLGKQIDPLADDKVVVQRVLGRSEAEKAGLKVGDVIARVNDRPVPNAFAAYQLLRDAEAIKLGLEDGRELMLALDNFPQRSLPVHPVQVYSSIDGFLLCLMGLALAPFLRRPGQVTALVLMLYAVTRFIEETVRDDQSGVFGTSLSIAQVVSIGTFVGAAVLLCITLLAGSSQLSHDQPPPAAS